MSRSKSAIRREREFAEQEQRQEKSRELFSAKMRQEKMEIAFCYGLWLAALLEKIWFQYCCKLSLYNPEHVIYFSMTSSFFFFIIGWVIGGEFKCERGLANFSFLSGFFTFTLVHMLFQVNFYQMAQLSAEMALACLIGAVLSLSYRRLKAFVRSLPKCFSRNQSAENSN